MLTPLSRCTDLATAPNRSRARIAGLVITRQRPGTASGVIFLTLEDETGVANVVVWNAVYEAHRRAVIAGRLVRITGEVQKEGGIVHLIARRIEDLSDLLDSLGAPIETAQARAPAHTEKGRRPILPRPPPRPRHPREQAKALFPSRDFH